MLDVHGLMDAIQTQTDGENAEIGVYDENDVLYSIESVDAQGGEGAPLAIQIVKAPLA